MRENRSGQAGIERGADCKGCQETSGGDENVFIPIGVMASWVYIFVRTHQIVHFHCT